jgi:hypothetical protein
VNVETPEDNRKREEARLTEEAYKLADRIRRAGFDPSPIINAGLQREQGEFRARRDAPIPRWKNQDERKSKFPAEVRNQILDYVWETQKQLRGGASLVRVLRGNYGRKRTKNSSTCLCRTANIARPSTARLRTPMRAVLSTGRPKRISFR